MVPQLPIPANLHVPKELLPSPADHSRIFLAPHQSGNLVLPGTLQEGANDL